MCAEIEQAFSKLNPGELSDVVETPYSFHIVKLIGRNYANGDDKTKADKERKLVSTHIAHIMIEKLFLKPEYREEEARDIVLKRMSDKATNQKVMELLNTLDITCKIPIFDNKEFKRPMELVK